MLIKYSSHTFYITLINMNKFLFSFGSIQCKNYRNLYEIMSSNCSEKKHFGNLKNRF